MKQRTLKQEVSISGKALHTGEEVTLTLKPAPVDTGYVFRRIDLYGKPEIRPAANLVSDLTRNTTIESGHTKLHTIEHVLASLRGSGIDNVYVELNASEPPILDGSAKEFVRIIKEAQPIEQDNDRDYFVLREPVCITEGDRSLIALPYNGFKITCTSADDRGHHSQYLSIEIDPESFMEEIASARTFVVYEDIEPLMKLGKIRGGSLDSAVVLKGDKVLTKEPLRFKDEFVRHKILDIVGDLTLLGKPVKAHIIAALPGHKINAALTKRMAELDLAAAAPPAKNGAAKTTSATARKAAEAPKTVLVTHETEMDVRRVLDTIPHRYPFVMIDRVVEFNGKDELTAIKNVTINEPYFTGHFPGRPVMPGVLQLEAMAQAAGILMLRIMNERNLIAFFMSADKVKFRRPVEPGDQIEIKIKMLKTRGRKLAHASGQCLVGGKVVSSADLMFTVVDTGQEV